MQRVGGHSRCCLVVVGVLLVVLASASAACGGSTKSSPKAAAGSTAATIPEATPADGLPSGGVTACSTSDIFSSGFTGTDGQHYSVVVKLGKPDCPQTGDIGLQGTIAGPTQVVDMGKLLAVGTIAGTPVGIAYSVPQGEVQANLLPANQSEYGLVIDFTSQTIEKVTLTGNGAPQELQRQ